MAHHHDTKQVLNRLSRAIGHLEAVKKMVEEGQDCSQVLIQLAAVKSALNNTGKIILKDHINHCIVEAVETGDKKALEDLSAAIDQFMKLGDCYDIAKNSYFLGNSGGGTLCP